VQAVDIVVEVQITAMERTIIDPVIEHEGAGDRGRPDPV